MGAGKSYGYGHRSTQSSMTIRCPNPSNIPTITANVNNCDLSYPTSPSMHSMHTFTTTFESLSEYPHVTFWAVQPAMLRFVHGLLLSLSSDNATSAQQRQTVFIVKAGVTPGARFLARFSTSTHASLHAAHAGCLNK